MMPADMTPQGIDSQAPPRWLERTLLLLLNSRDREAISGDLLEEYREEKLPLGLVRANYWYARQVVSFASIRILGGPLLRQLLVWVCMFTVVAGIWLGLMENILRHAGYPMRSAIAACIAIQGLATLLFIALKALPVLRILVMIGAAGIAFLGASAILRIARAQHFEGFVLIIGSALILQAALTLATLLPSRYQAQPR